MLTLSRLPCAPSLSVHVFARFVYLKSTGIALVWQVLTLLKDVAGLSTALNVFVSASQTGMAAKLVLAVGALDVGMHVLNTALFAAGLRYYVFILLGVQLPVRLLLFTLCTSGKQSRKADVLVATAMSYFSTAGALHVLLKPVYTSNGRSFVRACVVLLEALALPLITYVLPVFSSEFVVDEYLMVEGRGEGLFRNGMCDRDNYNCLPASAVWTLLVINILNAVCCRCSVSAVSTASCKFFCCVYAFLIADCGHCAVRFWAPGS
jgi:hypothetical protein